MSEEGRAMARNEPPAPGRAGAISEPLSARLRRLRNTRGLTLRALAALTGVASGHLSQLENATKGVRHGCGVHLFARVAKELGVTMDELYTGQPSCVLDDCLRAVASAREEMHCRVLLMQEERDVARRDLAAAQARAGALEAALCRYWAGDSCNCEPPFAVLCPNCEAAQALAALPPRAGEASHE